MGTCKIIIIQIFIGSTRYNENYNNNMITGFRIDLIIYSFVKGRMSFEKWKINNQIFLTSLRQQEQSTNVDVRDKVKSSA